MTTIKLEEFFNELLKQVNNNNLSPKMSTILSDLFITYQMEKDNYKINDFTNKNNDFNEMMKYYTLGWFYYNTIKSIQ
jgi:hypothetical protein